MRKTISTFFLILSCVLSVAVAGYFVAFLLQDPEYSLDKDFWTILCLDVICILITVSASSKYSWPTIWATGFLSGLIPPPFFMNGAAGTYGSIATLPLIGLLFLWDAHWIVYLLVILFFYVVGLLVVPVAQIELGPRKDYKGKIKDRDQNQIVIDEIIGMLVIFFTMKILDWHLATGQYALALLVGTLLFRAFDLMKKLPGIKMWHDRHNANGILADDVVAGIYGAVIFYGFLSWYAA